MKKNVNETIKKFAVQTCGMWRNNTTRSVILCQCLFFFFDKFVNLSPPPVQQNKIIDF